jgi:subtilase family serine protease
LRFFRSKALPLAAGVFTILLLFQSLPVLAVSEAAPTGPEIAAVTPPLASVSHAFSPHYIILGQLAGSTLVQSLRPRSTPLSGGIQFAATYYGPQDLQGAYGASTLFASGWNGRGETIAIIDAYGDPLIYEDIATYDKMFHLPPANLTVVPVGPYVPSNGITFGWDSEVALDVEAAHTMAPYAHINLVIAANASNALFKAVQLVVQRHLGDVASMSWGQGENSFGASGFSAAGFLNYPFLDYWFQQGVAEGMSFFASTGDFGTYDGTTTVTTDFPSTSPFVTGVGGTTLFLTPTSGLYSAMNSTAIYKGEEAWSVSPQYVGSPAGVSSGGGVSNLFPKPYYQNGTYPAATRTAPDVAAVANPYTGFLVVLEGGTYVIGGTSLASPLWAGMTAVLNQYSGRSLGLLNPYLYSIYANKAEYRSAFHQVSYGFNGQYVAGQGYNLVTGLGSPNLPQLAADIKSQAQGLSVKVSTNEGSSHSAPAQYTYGSKVTISAIALTPSGSSVSTGTFTASIDSAQGHVATVPLTYNGSSWVGSYTIGSTDPADSWSISVAASSGGLSGTAIGDINVGDSLNILSPVPYPFAPPTPPNAPFTIVVSAAAPNGTSLSSLNLTANLVYEGKTVTSVSLPSAGRGFYSGSAVITPGEPQGTYTLAVNLPGVGSAYTYLYIGEGLTGGLIGPNDEAIPSVAPGQLAVLLARSVTANLMGIYESNVTAKIYSLSGTLMASVKLQPAPKIAQFGAFDFFGYQQANFTIPSNFTEGFYKIQFLSTFIQNGAGGAQFGNFTTGFYVSGPTLSYKISNPSTVFEGQQAQVSTRITDSKGAPVTSGVFLATFIPTGYAFESYLADISGYSGVPMQYNPSTGEWTASYQIPSALTSHNAFVGNVPGLTYGPWNVFVSGESANGSNVIPSSAYFNVLPFTYLGIGQLNPSNIGSVPLAVVNGSGYALSNAAAGKLVIRGLQITLTNDNFGNLTLVNSKVSLVGIRVGSLSVTNSTIVNVGSSFNSVSPALPVITVSGLSAPVAGKTTFTADVAGLLLSSSSVVAQIDGAPVALTVTSTSAGVTASGTVDSSTLAPGVHILTLKATQADGLLSTYSTYFSVNPAGSFASQGGLLLASLYATATISVIAIVLAIMAYTRQRTAKMAPTQA